MAMRSWETESKSACPAARGGTGILRGLPAEADVTGTEPYGAMGAVVVGGGRDEGCCEWRSMLKELEGMAPCATCEPAYKAWLEGAVVEALHGLEKCGCWLG